MSDQPAQPVDDTATTETTAEVAPETASDDTTSEATSDAPPATTDDDALERPTTSGAATREGLVASLFIALAVLVVDQITKQIVVGHLTEASPVHVIWTLQWNLTHNSGMAFSRGTGIGPVLGALALVVVVVLVVSLRRHGTRSGRLAVGLVIGGAVGNLSDRLFRGDAWLRGSVVDFIDFQWWPIFNVADSAICVGGALLVLGAIFESTRQSRSVRSGGTASAK